MTPSFIVLFVNPHAIDGQLSGVLFLDIYDGHLGAAGFTANSVTDLHVIFIRHGLLQPFTDKGGGVSPAQRPMYNFSSPGER